MALLQSCLVNLSAQSRRWGPLLQHLPAIIAHLSSLVMLLLHAPAGISSAHHSSSPSEPACVFAGGKTHTGGGGGGGGEGGGGGGRGGRDQRAGVACEQRRSGDTGGIAGRWQVGLSAARLIALALRRSEAVSLDTRGVQAHILKSTLLCTYVFLFSIGFFIDAMRVQARGLKSVFLPYFT